MLVPVFSVFCTENGGVSSSEDDSEKSRKVNISLFSTSPEAVHTFPVLEVKDNTEYQRLKYSVLLG